MTDRSRPVNPVARRLRTALCRRPPGVHSPLNEIESAFWHQSHLPWSTTSLVVLAALESAPSADQLHDFALRLRSVAPRFGQTPVRDRGPLPGLPGPPVWTDLTDDRLAAACTTADVDGPWTEVVAMAARSQGRRHGPGEPLWTLTSLRARGGAAVALEVDHSLGDGGSIFRALVDTERPSPARTSVHRTVTCRSPAPPAGNPRPPRRRDAGAVLGGFLGVAVVTRRRGVSVLRLPMSDLREVAATRGVKVNDVHLAVLASAWGRFRRPDGPEAPVRVCVPIDTRAREESAAADEMVMGVQVVELRPDRSWVHDLGPVRDAVRDAVRRAMRSRRGADPARRWPERVLPGPLRSLVSLLRTAEHDLSVTTLEVSEPVSVSGHGVGALWMVPCTPNLASILTVYGDDGHLAMTGSPTAVASWGRFLDCVGAALADFGIGHDILVGVDHTAHQHADTG